MGGERDAQPSAQRPEDEAVEEVDGEDVREDPFCEDPSAEDLLQHGGDLDEGLDAESEDDAIEAGDEVIGVEREA